MANDVKVRLYRISHDLVTVGLPKSTKRRVYFAKSCHGSLSFIITFDIDHLRGLDIFNILMMCLLYLLNLEIARNFQYSTDSLRFN